MNSLDEIYKYIGGLLLFTFAITLNYQQRQLLIRNLTTAGFIISLLGLYQYFFGFTHILDYVSKANIKNPFILDYIQQKRVFLPFITPNTLGGYLIMTIPLACINKERGWFLLPLSLALLLTKSLGAFISISLALLLYFYLRGGTKKMRGLWFFGLLAIIGLVFVARTINQKAHLKPFFSTAMRWNYWKVTLEIIKVHLVTGIGPGNFGIAQSRFAHNTYLQIWAELGTGGLIAFGWLMTSAFKGILKNIRLSDNQSLFLLFTASTVFLIHNLVDFTFFLPEVAFVWWTVLGLAVSQSQEPRPLARAD